jgi:hypothetical protein
MLEKQVIELSEHLVEMQKEYFAEIANLRGKVANCEKFAKKNDVRWWFSSPVCQFHCLCQKRDFCKC